MYLIFWRQFFISVLPDFLFKNWIKYASIVLLVLIVPSGIISMQSKLHHFYFIVAANLCTLLFCLVYIYSIFSGVPESILKHQSSFWIIVGVLFYTAVTAPIFLGYYYLGNSNIKSLLYILFPLTNIAIIIMHLLFIKAYLCIIRPPKVLSS